MFPQSAFGKCLIQDIEWDNMKCSKCNVLLMDDHSTDDVDVKVCPVCGGKHARIKNVRIEKKCDENV